jgi:hypothetical protein
MTKQAFTRDGMTTEILATGPAAVLVRISHEVSPYRGAPKACFFVYTAGSLTASGDPKGVRFATKKAALAWLAS